MAHDAAITVGASQRTGTKKPTLGYVRFGSTPAGG
jgi:hypothetical protein